MPRYSIVGQKFLDLDPYLTGIPAGIPAELVREPENQYDPNAIQVWIEGRRVGYIPKKDNVALGKHMDRAGVEKAMAKSGIAADASLGHAMRITLAATFVRSPNSAYPQVELDL